MIGRLLRATAREGLHHLPRLARGFGVGFASIVAGIIKSVGIPGR